MDNNTTEMNFNWDAPPKAPTDTNIDKKVGKSYNKAGIGLIIHLVIASVVAYVIQIGHSLTYALNHAELAASDQAAYLDAYMKDISTTIAVSLGNNIGYLVANILAAIIIVKLVKEFKIGDFFGKGRFDGKNKVISVFAVLGVQMCSMMIFSAFMQLTGLSITIESDALSSTLDPTLTAINIVYFVLIAPVTEEILFRGAVLNALSPIDKKFAVVASALMFALFHGNAAQCFNAFFIGLILGYVAVKNGSIKHSIVIHMFANFNAYVIISTVFPYLSEKLGNDAANIMYGAWIIFIMIVGIISIAALLKRNGKINNETDKVTDYSFETDETEKKNLTWKKLFKAPAVLIFMIIYIGMMVFVAVSTNLPTTDTEDNSAVTVTEAVPEETAA